MSHAADRHVRMVGELSLRHALALAHGEHHLMESFALAGRQALVHVCRTSGWEKRNRPG